MAIINTFEKCLDSPYLSVDDTAPSEVASLLKQAEDKLRLAQGLVKAGSDDSVDTSYFSHEAMFCCLRALVYAKGYREAGLRCLLSALSALYVKDGLLDAAHIQAFEVAQSLKATPSTNLAAAVALVADTKRILDASRNS